MVRRLLVAVAVVSVVAACSSPTGPFTAPSTAAGTTSGSTSAAPTATTSATPAGTTSTPQRRTAKEDLARFLAEARRADARLRRAAALINAGIGDDVVRVDRTTVEAVRAAEPDAAARAVLPGLAPELLRRTLVVYNDLVARHAAMGYFQHPGSYSRAEARNMLECLARGAAAAPAARFVGDLASLERYVRTRPSSTTAGEDPEAEAELAIRLHLIRGRTQYADECGSAVFTDLAKLTWTVRPRRVRPGEANWRASPSGSPRALRLGREVQRVLTKGPAPASSLGKEQLSPLACSGVRRQGLEPRTR